MSILPATLAKEHAVKALAEEFGIVGLNYWGREFHELFERAFAGGKPRNAALVFRAASEIHGIVRHPGMPASRRFLPAASALVARGGDFNGGWQEAPALDLLEVPGGSLLRLAGAPVVVAADGVSVARDLSSVYAPLLYCYDVDVAERLADARPIAGPAMVLMSDIGDGNYCHWLLDELPRVALIRDRPGVRVIMADIPVPWRRETLHLLGIGDDRIIEIGPHEAARADTLLVPSCTNDMFHPAHKGADWLADFLRGSLGLPSMARQPAPEPDRRHARRLYIGRGDANSRNLLNEADLLRVLEPAGFVAVTLGGKTVPEQIALFAGAEIIVALHGAALANIVFCAPGTRLLEIFTVGHATAAFAIMAGAQRMPYAAMVADPGSPTDDGLKHCRLDVPAFWRLAEPWLRQSVLP